MRKVIGKQNRKGYTFYLPEEVSQKIDEILDRHHRKYKKYYILDKLVEIGLQNFKDEYL